MICAWIIGLLISGMSDVGSIREAVERASDGDTVRIQAGTYLEHGIVIDKKITLIGIGKPIVDGGGNGFIFRIMSDDVLIQGFIITGTGTSHVRDDAGIEIIESHRVRIFDNTLVDTYFGVYLAESDHVHVIGNTISAQGTRESTSGNGIHLFSSDSMTVTDNDIRGHRDGIYLEFVRGATIRNNHSEGNLRYGLHFMFSDNSRYEGNAFIGNGAGVAVMYSKQVDMIGNRFEKNWGPAAYGLLLKDITDSRVTNNRFIQNTIAMHVEGSSRMMFEGNLIRSNGWGMKVLANSLDNRISGNDFIENTFDMSTNSRSHVNHIERNHWSRFDGYDLNGDGIGDVAYRPVRLYAVLVERHPITLILMRTLFITMLDLAERVFPILTPEAMTDSFPHMKPLLL